MKEKKYNEIAVTVTALNEFSLPLNLCKELIEIIACNILSYNLNRGRPLSDVQNISVPSQAPIQVVVVCHDTLSNWYKH